MNQNNIGYLLILLIIILVFLLFYRQANVEYFENAKIINLYNEWHLGDCLYTMIYLNSIKDYVIQNNIIINFYINKDYIAQVSEFIQYDNIRLHELSNKPEDSINTWINYNDRIIKWINNNRNKYNYKNNKMPYNIYLTEFFTEFGKNNNLPELKELIYDDKDLIVRNNGFNNDLKNIDILILNSIPQSGQYVYDKEKFDNFIYKLNNKYKVITSEYVDNVLCTRKYNLSVKDIAALSINVKYVIAVNSGPLAALFNVYTMKNVKKWYTFDKDWCFSYSNFVDPNNFDEIEKELL